MAGCASLLNEPGAEYNLVAISLGTLYLYGCGREGSWGCAGGIHGAVVPHIRRLAAAVQAACGWRCHLSFAARTASACVCVHSHRAVHASGAGCEVVRAGTLRHQGRAQYGCVLLDEPLPDGCCSHLCGVASSLGSSSTAWLSPRWHMQGSVSIFSPCCVEIFMLTLGPKPRVYLVCHFRLVPQSCMGRTLLSARTHPCCPSSSPST